MFFFRKAYAYRIGMNQEVILLNQLVAFIYPL